MLPWKNVNYRIKRIDDFKRKHNSKDILKKLNQLLKQLHKE